MNRNVFFFLACMMPCLVCLGNQALRVEARFEPSTISLTNITTYKVVVHGSQEPPVGSIPALPGLRFSPNPRTFRSASFINGVPSIRFELTFQVTPEREGTFDFPSWSMRVGKHTSTAPSARLNVLPPNQSDRIRQAAEKQQQQDLREAAFIELNCPRTFLYEGETTEAQISLFLWERLPVTRIEQIPTKTGVGISMTELGQPNEQRNLRLKNKTYTSYSWTVGLTGTMKGVQNFSLSSILRVRVKAQRNSPLQSPFFNDPFFGFGREQGLEVKTDNISMEVRPLPQKGRPENFNGAIGSFTFETSVDKNRVSLGDPVRLTLKIKGKGNFSAMPAPELSLGPNFRSGPPAFHFDGASSTMYGGEQSFDYVITPLISGLLEIPTIEFSFFDPELETYETLHSSAHSVRVDPSDDWVKPEVLNTADNSGQTTRPTPSLFQTEQEPGQWVSRINIPNPLYSQLFWIINIIGFTLFVFLLFRKMRNKDPWLEKLKLKDKALQVRLKDCVKLTDRDGFYQSLKRMIRLRITMIFPKTNISALSTSELINLLHTQGFPPNVTDEISQLLHLCETKEYAGSDRSDESLDSLFSRARQIIRQIK